LGTTTSSVCKYSDSGTKSSFFTRSTRLLVIKLPLQYLYNHLQTTYMSMYMYCTKYMTNVAFLSIVCRFCRNVLYTWDLCLRSLSICDTSCSLKEIHKFKSNLSYKYKGANTYMYMYMYYSGIPLIRIYMVMYLGPSFIGGHIAWMWPITKIDDVMWPWSRSKAHITESKSILLPRD
jgi:hypothetical protein